MKKFLVWCLFLSVAGKFSIASRAAELTEDPSGQALAAELRSLRPPENLERTAVLKIRAGGRRQEITVRLQIVLETNSWQAIYETSPTSHAGAERLVVVHYANERNKYLHARAPTPTATLPKPMEISSDQANIPLAGSDFWLTDLGLDFLHWPEQQRLKGEMRLGQPCYVLESKNPKAQSITRVKSWIDKESGGILIAEGYDRDGKLVKEFSLSGSSFKRVNGNLQLEEMKIRSPKSGSQTILKFNLP